MIPYTSTLKVLDKIYLDTTFAVKSNPYRTFATKADGLRELLFKIRRYPLRTSFYFHAWTFGYEDVWIALSSALDSPIHVDSYKIKLYNSLKKIRTDRGLAPLQAFKSADAAALCGYQYGNRYQAGCLTVDSTSRIHSCERGSGCSYAEKSDVVHIIPIVSRASNGDFISELGAGGLGMAYIQELEIPDPDYADQLISLCQTILKDQDSFMAVKSLILSTMASGSNALPIQLLEDDSSAPISNGRIATILAELANKKPRKQTEPGSDESDGEQNSGDRDQMEVLVHPKTLRFPYSRHSSYSELRHLVASLEPKDVYPCTVDFENWTSESSMKALFGDVCSGNDFAFDLEMEKKLEESRMVSQCKKRPIGEISTDSRSPFSSEHTEARDTLQIESRSSRINDAVKGFTSRYSVADDYSIGEAATADDPDDTGSMSSQVARKANIMDILTGNADSGNDIVIVSEETLSINAELQYNGSVDGKDDPQITSKDGVSNSSSNQPDPIPTEDRVCSNKHEHEAALAFSDDEVVSWFDCSPAVTGNNHSTQETLL
ncbi:MAG: hypothetical protein M1825_000499 [Sarcosagium campestre]|nr:MAG: hypothetical protein M1825_000499 [Sarcosagium campestre]